MDTFVTSPKKSSALWIEIERGKKQVQEKKKIDDVDDSTAVLLLARFAETPRISFGKVVINSSKEATLVVRNPLDNDLIVTVEKVPEKKGFIVDYEFFDVKKLSEFPVKIVWTPTEVGNYRELITFRLDAIFCKQVVLLGSAVSPLKRILQPQNRRELDAQRPVKKKVTRKKSVKIKVAPRRHQKSNENKLQMTFIQRKSIPGLRNLNELESNDQTQDISTTIQTKLTHSPKATVYLRLTPDLQLRSSSSQPEAGVHSCDDSLMINKRQTYVAQPQRHRLVAPLTPPDKFEPCTTLASLSDRRSARSAILTPHSPDRRQTYNKNDIPCLVPIHGCVSPESCISSPSCSKRSKIPEPIYKIKQRSRRRSDASDLNDSLEGDRIDYSSCTTDESEIKPEFSNVDCEIKSLDSPICFGTEQTLQITELDYMDFCGNLNDPRSEWTKVDVEKREEYFDDEDEEEVLESSFRVMKCSTDRKALAKVCNVPTVVESRRELFMDQVSVKTLSSETFVMSKASCSTCKEETGLQQKRKSRKKTGIPSLQKKFSEAEAFIEKDKSPVHGKSKRNSSKTSDSSSSKERGPNKKKKTSRSVSNNQWLAMNMAIDGATSSVKLARAQTMHQLDSVVSYRPKLTLIKPPSKALTPCHPNPYAAKNIYYDEQWIEKQTQGFTRWLNFILTIPEELGEGEKRKLAANAPIEFSRDITYKQAPSREELSIRAYTVQKKMNMLRRKACNLYQSESIIKVITRLEHEIENRRIVIRSDKALHADVGIKQKLVELIMSYNSLWLRIGLETVFGQIIHLKSNDDTDGLSQFILNQLLNSPIISKEYAHSTVPHLFKPGFATSLKKHTLKKFLLLVYFLDQAKENYLIEFNPCLFNIESKFKSSRDILLAFSRDHLSGEGDLTKHLALFGYKVVYMQTALDEYDFSVSNLAVDLRNGLRLARAAQLLTQNWCLMTKLRVPAVTRMQKIHNVTCVLNILSENDVAIVDVTAKDVVNGHREKTLSLLWQLMFNFQVKLVLSEEKLKKELKILKKSLHFMGIDDEKYSNNNYKLFPDEKIELLLSWCQLVCAHYKIMVDNFTVSFSDGRVICYLINYYHPAVLRLEDIKKETTQSYIVPQDSVSSDDSFTANWTSSLTTNEKQEQLLRNEQENFKMALSKIVSCGGIPIMIKPSFMSNTIPDEKVTMVFVSYLCARFIDLSAEIRAAITIQNAWRRYQAKCLEESDLQSKTDAAIKIQQAIRRHFNRPQMKRQIIAAIKIQRRFRSYLLRQKYVKAKKGMIKLQAYIRSVNARRKFQRQIQSAVIIQKWTRICYDNPDDDENISIEKTPIGIQCCVCYPESHKTLPEDKKIEELDFLLQEAERDAAATSIQSFWRMCSARMAYKRKQTAILKIQAGFRGYLTREMFLEMKESAIFIQVWYRSYIITRKTRACFLKYKDASIKVQRWYRSSRETLIIRERFLVFKRAAIAIQDWYRSCKKAVVTRLWFLLLKRSITTIQRWFRRNRQTKQKIKVMKLTKASVIIQQWYRRSRQTVEIRMKFLELKSNVLTIQRWYRCTEKANRIRIGYLNLKWDVITIQRWYRHAVEANRVRMQFLDLKWDVITIQRWFRRCKEARNTRMQFLNLKQNVLTIQRRFRWLTEANAIRMRFLELKRNVVVIQRWYRRCNDARESRTLFLELKRNVVIIQRWFRSSMTTRQRRMEFLEQKQAVVAVKQWYRRLKETLKIRKEFLDLKLNVVTIQRWFRSVMFTRQTRREFLEEKRAAIIVQQWFRRTKEAWKIRMDFLEQKCAAITIQRWYRLSKEAKKTRSVFLKRKQAAVIIQHWYRQTIEARETVMALKRNVVTIQRWYRRCIQTTVIREEFLQRKQAAICVQTWYRRTVQANNARMEFLQLKRAAVIIQQRFRSTIEARKIRMEFLRRKQASIIVQQWYRCVRDTKKLLELEKIVILIQRWYRRCIEMKRYITRFIEIKQTAIRIQQWYRSTKLAIKTRMQFMELKLRIVFIQKWYRRRRELKKEREQFLEVKRAVVTIQNWYRGIKTMRQERETLITMKRSVIIIESWWFRYCEAKLDRDRFLALKHAAIYIQRWYRTCTLVHARLSNSAVIIQRRYRSMKMARDIRIDYLDYITNVVRIQRRFRNCVETRKQRNAFIKVRQSVVIIQQWYRKCSGTRRSVKLERAAIIIQRWYKRNKEAQQEIRVCKIQDWYRRCKKTQKIRRSFLVTKRACVVIQCWYKCLKQDEELAGLNDAVLCIQRWYRGWKESMKLRMMFLERRKAAVLLQKCYKAKKCREMFLLKKMAAIEIQKWFRCCKNRDEFVRLKNAVVCIENWYVLCNEARRQRSQFLLRKKAAMRIQRFYRQWEVAKRHRWEIWAAVTLQRYIRGWVLWRKFTKMKQAVIIIQKHYRLAKSIEIEKKLWAVDIIQTFFRGYMKTKAARREFLRVRAAVIVVQKNWRMKKCVEIFKMWDNAARVVQRFFRACLQVREDREKLLSLKWAAVVIQSCFRMRKQLRYFKTLRKYAVIIQKNYRCKLYQREFLEIKKSALVIQKRWRCTMQRRNFLKMKTAIIYLQSVWKGYDKRMKYHIIIKSVVCIQKWYRSTVEMRELRRQFIIMKLVAVKIQTWFKCRLGVRKYKQIRRSILGLQRHYRAKKVMISLHNKIWAIEVLQSHWIAFIKGRRARERFLMIKYSAIVLQSWFRMLKHQREFAIQRNSAVTIQKIWRMVTARRNFLRQKQSVLILEEWVYTSWETRVIRESYLSLKGGVMALQSMWRRYRKQKRLRAENDAAIAIQNWYYNCQLTQFCRTEFLELKYYTIRMQAIRRGNLDRRQLFYMNVAAVAIQSGFRKWKERNNFRLFRGCAIVIQRFWRSCQLTRILNEEFLLKKTACIMLQAFIRGVLIRKRYLFLKYSAIVIQSYIRGFIERKRYRRLRVAVLVIQRYWRCRMLCRWEFTQYHVIRGAVIVIQSYLRGYIVRRKVKSGVIKRCSNFTKLSKFYDDLVLLKQKKGKQINAVIKIQAAIRGVLARRKLEKERCVCWKFRCSDYVNFAHCRRLQMLNAVGIIERYYQCYKVRQIEFMPEDELQMKVAGFSKWTKRLLMQRRWLLVMRTAATIIQSAWQAWMVGRVVRFRFLELRMGTVRFQAAARGFLIASRENYLKCFAAAAKLQLSALRLQRWVRECNKRKINKCATVIQAAWRGYKLRSAQNDRRISDARSRINEANQSAVLENTLWNRTTSGLDSIFNCRRLSTVWKALNNLNASTRLSPVCCERLSDSGGVVILYQIIEGCNRSVPHMEVIIECLSVLVNLAKHEPSRTQVWQPEGCGQTLIKLMRQYFEKNEKIVLKCCSVMWIICQDKSCVKLFTSDTVMMKSTSNLCAAVSRRFQTRGLIESSPTKSALRKKASSRISFKPDWFLGNDVDREFTVYVKAFPLVIEMMNKMGICDGCNCHQPDWLKRITENKNFKRTTTWLRRNSLLVSTILAITIGMIVGIVVRHQDPSSMALELIAFPGEIFLRMLKLMIIPIIIASIVTGTTALDPKTHGRMALSVLGYFLLTSLISSTIGVFLVTIIHPGHPDIEESSSIAVGVKTQPINKLDAFIDVLLNGLPENIIEATLKQSYTVYEWKKPDIAKVNEKANGTFERRIASRGGSNTLGLIVFFMIFGSMLNVMGEKGQLIAQYFYCLNDIIMKMVSLAIWFMPLGVASIVCERMASLADRVFLLEDLSLYCLTVVFGLAIHQFILLPLLYFIVLRKNPFPFYWNTMQAIVTAFATESSAAALPVTIQNMEEKNGCNKYITKFILPIGANINMDGTALFIAVASLFIAQINGYEATVGEIITIIFTSTAVSVASAAVPSASIYLMAMTLSVLPIENAMGHVNLLLIIDWLLGRFRTVNNVVGDCYAVALFQHIYREDIAKEWIANQKFGFFIDGETKFPNDRKTFPVINPNTGSNIATVLEPIENDVKEALESAHKTFTTWSTYTGETRARHLYRIAREIQKHQQLLTLTECLQTGKTINEVKNFDIPQIIRVFYYYAGSAQLHHTKSEFEPHGVTVIFPSWNFPAFQIAKMAAPALAAGNTVIVKIAAETPLSAYFLAELINSSGFPPGVFNVISGTDEKITRRLLEDVIVRKISFVGSRKNAIEMRCLISGMFKHTSLELDGKCALIVFDNVDQDSVVEEIIYASFSHNGQSNFAASRLFIQETIFSEMISKLKNRMVKLRIGNGMDKTMDFGSIINEKQLNKIRTQVEIAKRDGAKVFQPPNSTNATGNYFFPTLITGIDPGSSVVMEELLGPVLVAFPFRTAKESIALANNSAFGVAAGVFTENTSLAMEVASSLKVGTVWINCYNVFDAAASFGGRKQSGYGRHGGKEGLYEYLTPKLVERTKFPYIKKADQLPSPTPRYSATFKMYIGGVQTRPDGNSSRKIFNSSNDFLAEVGEGNRKDIRNAVEAAQKVQIGWAKRTAHNRAQILYYIAENLEARRSQLILDFRQIEFQEAIRHLFHWAASCDKFGGSVNETISSFTTIQVNEPIGVIGISCPDSPDWPLLPFVSLVAMAIAFGNTVVVIPSKTNPLPALDLIQVFETSDVPGGVINIVTGDQDNLAETLAQHHDVNAF
uniref:Calponin-homology (CH) domain-containing protein n=1 Tax=Strigamia maritima TaxID=126957 RepID=T1J799_STRMM